MADPRGAVKHLYATTKKKDLYNDPDLLMAMDKLGTIYDQMEVDSEEMPKDFAKGTNAGAEGPLGNVQHKVRLLPSTKGSGLVLTSAGHTNTRTGKTYVSQDHGDYEDWSNTAAHETVHQNHRSKYMPEDPYKEAESEYPLIGGSPTGNHAHDARIRKEIAKSMEMIQPNGNRKGKYWGLNPNRSAEEQIANLRGYEGMLPEGTSLRNSPIAKDFFTTRDKNVTPKDMLDYYYEKSSLPYKGMWEGQVPDRSYGDKLNELIRMLSVKLGFNRERR